MSVVQLCWLVAMCLISTSVADTILGMVDFGSSSFMSSCCSCRRLCWLCYLGSRSLGLTIPNFWVTRPYRRSHRSTLAIHGILVQLTGASGAGFNWPAFSRPLGFPLVGSLLGQLTSFALTLIDSADEMFGHFGVVGSSVCALMHSAQDGEVHVHCYACNCTFRRSWSCGCRYFRSGCRYCVPTLMSIGCNWRKKDY